MYGDDLAWVQHRAFSGFAREAAPELLRLRRAHGIRSGHVVDVGCGDGSWLQALTGSGFTATGIEPSAALARYARRAAPRATVRYTSFARASLGRCSAITAIGEVFNYLPAPSLLATFRRAFAALEPGGVLIFDMLVAGRRMGYQSWHTGPGWVLLLRVNEDLARRRLTRRIVVFRRRGRAWTRADETHGLRVPTGAEVLAALRRTGFTARSSRGYGAVALLPRRAAFVAKKPGRGRTGHA